MLKATIGTFALVVSMFIPISAKAQAIDDESCPVAPEAGAGEHTVQQVPEGTDVVQCGLVGDVVTDGDMAVPLPSTGMGVTLEMLWEDGAETFTVTVDSEGKVEYTEDPAHLAEGTSGASSSPSACSDGAYSDEDEEQAGQWDWYIGDGTRPGGLSTTQTVDALELALNGLSIGYTDCTTPVNWSPYRVSSLYNGVTSLESDFHIEGGDSKCGDESFDGRDGTSTVDFGNLDGNGNPAVASECTWFIPQPGNNNIIESDVRFNTTDKNFYVYNRPANCTAGPNFELRSVAIHEFGHTFGMGHVAESTHGNLTMSTITSRCDTSQQTLGKGDILSLNNTYS